MTWLGSGLFLRRLVVGSNISDDWSYYIYSLKGLHDELKALLLPVIYWNWSNKQGGTEVLTQRTKGSTPNPSNPSSIPFQQKNHQPSWKEVNKKTWALAAAAATAACLWRTPATMRLLPELTLAAFPAHPARTARACRPRESWFGSSPPSKNRPGASETFSWPSLKTARPMRSRWVFFYYYSFNWASFTNGELGGDAGPGW